MVTRVQKLIGKSYENRNIYLYEFFVEKPKLNVLLTGSIHGTESESGDALLRLMDDIEDTNFYDDVNVAVLPYWNVDGNANQTYANAQGFQINWSILSAATPEIRALWEYLRDNMYYPDFYIDNHNLDRWCRGAGYYLYDHVPRLALNADLVIGSTATLSSLYRHKLTWKQWTDIVSHVSSNDPNHIYEKYWEVDDYANIEYLRAYDFGHIDCFLAARLDCLTMLIEGVVPADQTPTNPEWEPTKQAQFLANKYMIDWVRKHPEVTGTKSVPPYVGEKIPIHETKKYELLPDRMKVENDATGSVTYFWSNTTKGKLWSQNSNDDPLQWTTAPLAYAIHNTNEEELNVYMKWWGFWWSQGQTTDSYDTEQFHCTSADAWNDEEGNIPYQYPQSNINGYNVSATRTNFSQYTIYSVNQLGGLALIHLLEPLAWGNISRHQTLFPTLELVPNDDFPILRLIRKR